LINLFLMSELYFKSKDGDILILDSEDDSILYRIRREELMLKMTHDLSEWIMQLEEKTWMDSDALYRLAQFIKLEFPDNTIDWYNTFFVVEKGRFLEELFAVMYPEKQSLVDRAFGQITFNREESTEENHKIVHEILIKKLVDFQL
jgi:hypothetical protein